MNRSVKRAYFDIETTGFDRRRHRITVFGVFYEDGPVVQLYPPDVVRENVESLFDDVDRVYTFNGKSFDVPFVKGRLGFNPLNNTEHVDLMYECRRLNLTGGLKKIEKMLGISREGGGGNGWQAVQWWKRYQQYGDREALHKLLKYNRLDVINLKILREKIKVG